MTKSSSLGEGTSGPTHHVQQTSDRELRDEFGEFSDKRLIDRAAGSASCRRCVRDLLHHGVATGGNRGRCIGTKIRT
jgi:hypothetical protein